jgi:NadR type nicotinamide-nucleotide adenylyltransferase
MVGVAAIDATNRDRLTVAIVGAECSGKTTLARALAAHFGVSWIPEYAREYLAGHSAYDQDDLIEIARGQQRAEAHAAGGQLAIADTDLIVIKVWWDVRFGGENSRLDAMLDADLSGNRRRAYLLTTPDIPWVGDPLRENPLDRPALHARYRTLLDTLQVPYAEISGSRAQRLERAVAAVRRWLSR